MKDIYLKPTPAGPDFDILPTGLPRMTGGLANYIYLLLTMCDWCGNEFASEGGKFSSNLQEIMASNPLTNKVRLDVIEEVKRLLAPLTILDIAESYEVEGIIPKVGTLYLVIKIFQPNTVDPVDYVYSLNWEEQKIMIQEGKW
jgi:hypothetical protein